MPVADPVLAGVVWERGIAEASFCPDSHDAKIVLDYNQIRLYYNHRKYEVKIQKKALRGLEKLPGNVRKLLFLLIEDLKADGPIQKGWHNFSPLGNETYHCHLNYRYVACWTHRQGEIVIEVYYVGSREKAPY